MPHRDTPRFLYKFRCLNDHTAKLTHGELHFDIPTGLNDPFECWPVYCTDCTREEFRKAIRQPVSIKHAEYSASQIDQATLAESYPPPQSKLDSFTSRFRKSVEGVGVFSASERWDSIVMWSHYAHHHQGICLELDTRTLPEDHQFHQVIYSKNRPHVNLFTGWQGSHKIVAFTKNDDWQYEAEWRMVLHSPSEPEFPCEVDAPKGFIHGIILGARMKPAGRETVLGWVEQMNPRPKLYEASVDERTYRINRRALGD